MYLYFIPGMSGLYALSVGEYLRIIGNASSKDTMTYSEN